MFPKIDSGELAPSEVYETQALEAIKTGDFEKSLVYAVLAAANAAKEAAEVVADVFDTDDEDEDGDDDEEADEE